MTTLRTAHTQDAEALRRLAALDSAPALTGPVLLAEVDGELVAALATETDRVVADPFRWTANAVELLRAAAAPTMSGWQRSASLVRRPAVQ